MKTNRHIIYITAALAAFFAATSCHVEELFDPTHRANLYDGELVEARLNVVVNELNVDVSTRGDAEVSDYKEVATDEEKYVADLWVFQYDATTEELLTYSYYTVSDQAELSDFPVDLAPEYSYIHIVTNTQDPSWVTDSNYIYFGTMSLLKSQTLPNPFPIIFDGGTEDNPIPMEGMNEDPVTPGVTRSITVPVTRMYAKIKVKVYFAEILQYYYYDVEVNYLDFRNIPEYCRIGSLAEDQKDEEQVAFPSGISFSARALNKIDEEKDGDEDYYPYVIYVPESLGGESSNSRNTPSVKADEAPSDAFYVRTRINYKTLESANSGTSTNIYTTYPGGNSYNNYNIRRNCVYRLTVNIGYPLGETISGSANSYVGMEGDLISFYPYFREEHGGGYDISDYLDSTDSDKTIDHLEIIWQDKDCIGDNSAGNLVWIEHYEDETDPTLNYKIYVQTNKAGNALVGAYNSAGTIIWSWHIWVREQQYGDPTNLGNAMLYYTYDWDETGIKTESPRVSGYPIMSCNLGAMQDEPVYENNSNFGNGDDGIQTYQDGDCITRTFGLLYQWGRKDPFPPMIATNGATGTSAVNTGYYIHDYDDEHTGNHYANDNTTIVHKTAYDENGSTYDGATKYDSYLFHSHIASIGEGMQYSIEHPTVFLCGVDRIAQCLTTAIENGSDYTGYVTTLNNYLYRGAWSEEDTDDQEWGASEVTASTKRYDTGLNDAGGGTITLYDNYGDEKSIFDPCPYGWRVPPGELWLGFTKNGLNSLDVALDQNNSGTSGSLDNINEDPEKSCLLGLSMYLGPTWRSGLTSWFPTQGFRLPDGTGYRVGGCGCYANANADKEGTYDRINALHIHDGVRYFRAFEISLPYTVKSSANTIRCVRDTK